MSDPQDNAPAVEPQPEPTEVGPDVSVPDVAVTDADADATADAAAATAAAASAPESKADSKPPASPSLRSDKLKLPAVRPTAQSRNSMNGPLYMQNSNNKVLIRRVRRKDDGVLKSLSRWFLDNQTGLSFNLIALVFLAHVCIPKARPHTLKFFTLSYYNPATDAYAAGSDDWYFISFCVILVTGLRAGFMENILAPLAKYWGVNKKKDVTRFSEQAWLLVYYGVFWPVGLYLYVKSPYFLNNRELWTNYPNRELSGAMKTYLLAQWGFWLQQVLVINIEERRKDHWQMLTHHFVTISLIAACYAYHHTRIGHLILMLMDVVDLFLPLAKCLKYMGYSKLCDLTFVLFMVSWFFARHVFYLSACWSIWKHVPEIMPQGCWKGTNGNITGPIPAPDGFSHIVEPFTNPEGLVCYTEPIRFAFLAVLLFLQLITIGWFIMIINVAMRVLKGQGADDTRSDDEAVEGEEEKEDEFEYAEAQAVEEEVGVEAIDLKGWERRSGVKRNASSSGVSLPGHSDRKELLGRIGCEKQVD